MTILSALAVATAGGIIGALIALLIVGIWMVKNIE